ncbi:MAG: hypothetical protein MUO22_07880 [Sedimentisphaerales bacterium]|nr:hypothetical protein [Sedimentisphaerales bacterium]
MDRFEGQDYPAPRWRRAAPAAQERVEGKSQTAPKEMTVAGMKMSVLLTGTTPIPLFSQAEFAVGARRRPRSCGIPLRMACNTADAVKSACPKGEQIISILL